MNEPQTLLTGKRYTSAVHTDIRRLFDRIAPGWNLKPKPVEKVPIRRKKGKL